MFNNITHYSNILVSPDVADDGMLQLTVETPSGQVVWKREVNRHDPQFKAIYQRAKSFYPEVDSSPLYILSYILFKHTPPCDDSFTKEDSDPILSLMNARHPTADENVALQKQLKTLNEKIKSVQESKEVKEQTCQELIDVLNTTVLQFPSEINHYLGRVGFYANIPLLKPQREHMEADLTMAQYLYNTGIDVHPEFQIAYLYTQCDFYLAFDETQKVLDACLKMLNKLNKSNQIALTAHMVQRIKCYIVDCMRCKPQLAEKAQLLLACISNSPAEFAKIATVVAIAKDPLAVSAFLNQHDAVRTLNTTEEEKDTRLITIASQNQHAKTIVKHLKLGDPVFKKIRSHLYSLYPLLPESSVLLLADIFFSHLKPKEINFTKAECNKYIAFIQSKPCTPADEAELLQKMDAITKSPDKKSKSNEENCRNKFTQIVSLLNRELEKHHAQSWLYLTRAYYKISLRYIDKIDEIQEDINTAKFLVETALDADLRCADYEILIKRNFNLMKGNLFSSYQNQQAILKLPDTTTWRETFAELIQEDIKYYLFTDPDKTFFLYQLLAVETHIPQYLLHIESIKRIFDTLDKSNEDILRLYKTVTLAEFIYSLDTVFGKTVVESVQASLQQLQNKKKEKPLDFEKIILPRLRKAFMHETWMADTPDLPELAEKYKTIYAGIIKNKVISFSDHNHLCYLVDSSNVEEKPEATDLKTIEKQILSGLKDQECRKKPIAKSAEEISSKSYALLLKEENEKNKSTSNKSNGTNSDISHDVKNTNTAVSIKTDAVIKPSTQPTVHDSQKSKDNNHNPTDEFSQFVCDDDSSDDKANKSDTKESEWIDIPKKEDLIAAKKDKAKNERIANVSRTPQFNTTRLSNAKKTKGQETSRSTQPPKGNNKTMNNTSVSLVVPPAKPSTLSFIVSVPVPTPSVSDSTPTPVPSVVTAPPVASNNTIITSEVSSISITIETKKTTVQVIETQKSVTPPPPPYESPVQTSTTTMLSQLDLKVAAAQQEFDSVKAQLTTPSTGYVFLQPLSHFPIFNNKVVFAKSDTNQTSTMNGLKH